MISRPSRNRHCSCGAEAPSMPEGRAERTVEATRAHARACASRAESMDGAEHRASIEAVVAGSGSRCGEHDDDLPWW
jgi:hypothetical protein